MEKTKVLFVCVHNAARSQMAEALLNSLAVDVFEAQSAGLEPGTLNPLAVEVMKEAGIDISGNKTKSVFDFYKDGKLFSYVITVCDAARAEQCPIFPGLLTKQSTGALKTPRRLGEAIKRGWRRRERCGMPYGKGLRHGSKR